MQPGRSPLAGQQYLRLTPLAALPESSRGPLGNRPRHCRYQSGYPETEAEACVSRYLQSILPLIKAENGSHITVRLEGGKGCEAMALCSNPALVLTDMHGAVKLFSPFQLILSENSQFVANIVRMAQVAGRQ